MINTATVLGGLAGRLIGGYIADRWGRRAALSLNLLVYTLGGLISAAAVNYEMLLASRFIVGIGLGGEFTVGLAILAEIVATRHRGSLLATLNISSGGSATSPPSDSSGWCWDRSTECSAVTTPRGAGPTSSSPCPPCSSSSSAATCRSHHASCCQRAGWRTPTRASPGWPVGTITGLRKPGITKQFVTRRRHSRQVKSSYIEVFKGQNLKRTTAIGAASWMSFGAQVTLLFLMPILLVSRGYSLSDSLAFTMIMNIGSLFGACAASYLAGKAPRRLTVSVAAILGCISAICFASFANTTALILVLGMIFQFFTMMLNTMLSVWSPELFPTSVRAMGTSVVNGIGNVAGAVMPFAALFFFDRAGVAGVFMMIAVMYVLLVVAARFGPETFGKPLEAVTEKPGPRHGGLIRPPRPHTERMPNMLNLNISATAHAPNYLPQYYAESARPLRRPRPTVTATARDPWTGVLDDLDSGAADVALGGLWVPAMYWNTPRKLTVFAQVNHQFPKALVTRTAAATSTGRT